MKKLFNILLVSTSCLFVQSSVCAQDSTASSASKQINKTSEQADVLYGKKIQQQSLLIKPAENADTVAAIKTKRKSNKTCGRNH